MSRRVFLGALLMAVVLAGCSGDVPAEASAQLSVEGADRLVFEPTELTVPAGEQVTLELTAGEHTPETGRFSRFKSQTALEDRATLNPAPPPTVAIRIQGQPDQYPRAG